MLKCKFCGRAIGLVDLFCKNCGYDPKTDRIRPNFIPPSTDQTIKSAKRHPQFMSGLGVSPGVRKFALIGLAIFIFSIFYKNHFSLTNVIAEVRHTFTMISKGKFKIRQEKNKKIEYIDVRTFKD